MKNKIWILSLPVIFLMTFLYVVREGGIDGNLSNHVLREKAFPLVRSVEGWVTNQKFVLRGPIPPKNKIVIAEIDNASLDQFGRWPWHRDVTAYVIEKIIESGAKLVALDIVFSEPDVRVPEELASELNKNKLGHLVDQFETDLALAGTFQRHQTKIVTGFTSDLVCQPAYRTISDECPVDNADVKAAYPKEFDKFSFEKISGPSAFDILKTPLLSMPLLIANLPMYNEASQTTGYFNTFMDSDGFIRRSNLLMMAEGKPFGSLALQAAKVALNEEIAVDFTEDEKVKRIAFAKSGRTIPVSPLGAMEINFRGGAYTFPYVSTLDIVSDEAQVNVTRTTNKVALVTKEDRSEMFKDAIVLLGISALGAFDMRAFPYDSNVPGVEGHANILDNLLSNDMMTSGSSTLARIVLVLMLTVVALIFAFAAQKLDAVPGLAFFAGLMCTVGIVDMKVLFAQNHNWPTGFLYLEYFGIFIITTVVKYVLEERNKKFIKGAFSKYVAPAVVDSIMKDPTQLTVGGNKKDLSILFSDIRSFTTFSEQLDPKQLSNFLNDYLGLMTDIVFEFNGTLDKYIGDAIMAFWGAPLDQADHARKSCLAAAKMQKVLAEHRKRYKDTYGIDVMIGAGINSGNVTVGNMGSERIFAYTVIGDHVNLASRLEGLTKYYGAGVLTTRYTFDMIQSAGLELPPHRIIDSVKVKGKNQAVEVIEVLSQDLSAQGLAKFQEARSIYRLKKWDDAIAVFQEADRLCRQSDDGDGPSRMFIERCRELKVTSLEADWDGSWVMTSK